MSSMADNIPTREALSAAYQKQKPYTRVTPLLPCKTLSEHIAGSVLIKAESLQETGAFKFRGAIFRLLLLTNSERERGVTAFSSGNFARGLAAAGQVLEIRVTLVMPSDAPANKIKQARKLGAEVILCDDRQPTREEAAQKLAEELAHKNASVLLHPFDDLEIIKGQAAVAVELKEQLLLSGHYCDSLLCPTGGGSLVAGCGLEFGSFQSKTQVYAVEPEGFAGMCQSLVMGQRGRAGGRTPSHCDALLACSPGVHNFRLARATGIKGLQVTEHYVIKAVQLAFEELKLVLEPSGAIALAALLQYPRLFTHQSVVVMATGGNVDPGLFSEILMT